MSEPLRVALVGSAGRMGRFARELIEAADDLELAACIEVGDPLEERLSSSGAGVGLDLTLSGFGALHGLAMLDAGLHPVIGTSGVTPEEDAALDARARELGLGGLVVPNFCVGMVLLNRAAEEAARWFDAAEITEVHRPHKRDAPSGTALDTARRIAAVRAGTEPVDAVAEPRARGQREAGVPIHSQRLPGVDSRQEVLFGGEEELFVLRHEAQGPRAFGPGLLASLRYASRATGVARGLEHALGLLER